MKPMPTRIQVTIFQNGYAPCMYQLRPVSNRWCRQFVRAVVDNGGPDERTALLSGDDLAGLDLSERHRRELQEWGEVTVLMDPWTVGHCYGYDAAEAATRP